MNNAIVRYCFLITFALPGYDAMMRGDGDIVTGWKNKLLSAMSNAIPSDMLAEIHRRWPSLEQVRKRRSNR